MRDAHGSIDGMGGMGDMGDMVLGLASHSRKWHVRAVRGGAKADPPHPGKLGRVLEHAAEPRAETLHAFERDPHAAVARHAAVERRDRQRDPLVDEQAAPDAHVQCRSCKSWCVCANCRIIELKCIKFDAVSRMNYGSGPVNRFFLAFTRRS